MDEQEIIDQFTAELKQKTAMKVFNLTKHQASNYRNKQLPTLGTMLELLYKAGLIKVTKNEPEGEA